MFVFHCSVIASYWDPFYGRLFSMFSYEGHQNMEWASEVRQSHSTEVFVQRD